MTDDQMLAMFGVVLGANLMTIMAVYGVVQLSKLEQQSKAEGRKMNAPLYLYLMVLGPAAIGIIGMLSISS